LPRSLYPGRVDPSKDETQGLEWVPNGRSPKSELTVGVDAQPERDQAQGLIEVRVRVGQWFVTSVSQQNAPQSFAEAPGEEQVPFGLGTDHHVCAFGEPALEVARVRPAVMVFLPFDRVHEISHQEHGVPRSCCVHRSTHDTSLTV
jgi:hypothetical protein